MSISSTHSIPYKFGWLPDVPDRRDIPFSAIFRVPAKVPAKIDLRGGCSPVEQQGNLGSCTAQALVGGLEFLELRNLDSGAVARHGVARLPHTVRHYNKLAEKFQDLSRLFVYYNEREAMGTIMEDSGAMLRTGIKVL